MRTDCFPALPRALIFSLVFLLSALTLKSHEIGFVEIPDGVVDEELRAEVEALVEELANRQEVALGVIVLENATREEALTTAATARSEEQFVDLVIHLVLSTAGPEQDGHLVRVNLPQQQDEKVLVQPFFNAFGRCREKNLDDRVRQLLAEVSDQVEVFVLQRSHERGKFGSDDSEAQSSVEVPLVVEDSQSELWLVIVIVTSSLLIFVLVIVLLMKAVAPKALRFDPVTVTRRLQAPYAGGSPYLLKFKKKYRR